MAWRFPFPFPLTLCFVLAAVVISDLGCMAAAFALFIPSVVLACFSLITLIASFLPFACVLHFSFPLSHFVPFFSPLLFLVLIPLSFHCLSSHLAAWLINLPSCSCFSSTSLKQEFLLVPSVNHSNSSCFTFHCYCVTL